MTRSGLASIMPSFNGFLNWWRRELLACIPERFLVPFKPKKRVLLVQFLPDGVSMILLNGRQATPLGRVDSGMGGGPPVEERIARLLRKANLRKSEIVLQLPAEQTLRWELPVPSAAEADLRQALKFQIESRMPWPAGEACFDYRIKSRGEGGAVLIVEVVVALRSDVGQALAKAKAWGLVPTAVDAAHEHEFRFPQFNLLREGEELEPARAAMRLNIGLALILLILTAISVGLPLHHLRQESARLASELEQTKALAEETRRLQQEIDVLAADTGFLVKKRLNRRAQVEALDHLSQLLPDDSWLSQMTIEGGEVKMTGQSAAATALIGLINASPWFRDPRFLAPVTQDLRAGRERFNMSFRIEESRGKP